MLPWMVIVWVRVPQALDGGRSIVTLATVFDEPRSTWNHWGKALSVLSQ